MSSPASTDDAEIARRFAQAARKLETDDFAATRETFVELRAHQRFHERSCNALVHIDRQLDQLDNCLEHLTELIATYPQTLAYAASYLALARSVEQQRTALGYLLAFAEREPANADVHLQLGQAYRTVGEHRNALAALQQALDLAVAYPQDVLVSMAVVHADLGEHDHALAKLERALRIDAKDYAALFNRASLLEEVGDKPGATQAYEQVIATYPDALLARVRHIGLQDPSAAALAELEALERQSASAEQPYDARVQLAFASGQLADQLGQYDLAWSRFCVANRLQEEHIPPYNPQEFAAHVDRLIAAFDDQWFAHNAISNDAQPAFICGMFRSGSTLLEALLGTHSAVIAGGELDFFVSAARAVGSLPDTQRWTKPALVELAANYQQLLDSFATPELIRLNKRPDNVLHIGLIKTLFPDARVFITRRQLAENCLSVFSHPLGPQQNYATSIDNIAHYYQQLERLAQHWQARFPDSVAVIDYESLVTDPEAQLRRAFELLGVAAESGYRQFHQSKAAARTASVWQVRKPLYTDAIHRADPYRQWLGSVVGD